MTAPSVPLRHLCAALSDGTHGTYDRVANGVPLLSAKNIRDGVLEVLESESQISNVDFQHIDRKGSFRPGDLLLTIVGSIGRVATLDTKQPLAFQRSVASLRPNSAVLSRYLYWALQSAPVQSSLQASARQAAQAGVYLEDVARVPVPLPPLEEQRRIADFLDDQVALLDRAVALRKEQIALLHELAAERVRRAVLGLTEAADRVAVTTPWIGSVPVTWTVQPLGRRFDIQLGKMLAPDRVAGAHLRPYLRNTNVQWDRVDTDDLLLMDFPPQERARYEVRPGDLLVCEGGEVGRAAIWTGALGEVYYQKALHRVRPTAETGVRWVYYVLLAATRMGVFTAESGTTIAHLTGEQLRAHRVPFPPRDVEGRLVAQLDEAAQQQQLLKDLAVRQVTLLQERKQALITAAVTGQLDVITARSAA